MIKKDQEHKSDNKIMLRYFFTIFLSIGSILAVIFGILYNLESKDYLKRLEFEEEVKINIQLELITNNFDTIISDLLFLSKQNELQHLINTNEQTYKSLISSEYLEFCREKRIYDQIRFLDETGMEVVRINFNNGEPEIIDQGELQFKGDRYYFKDTFVLDENEIFVSILDLNIEKGEIEKPLKPMIRFGVPIFDSDGTKHGVIIINYLGEKLIKSLKDAAELSTGNLMLVNSDGYWLYSPVTDDEWGFMIEERNTSNFSNRFPEVWNDILRFDSNQIYSKDGFFTSVTIYPLKEGLQVNSGSVSCFGSREKNIGIDEYYWKIISHIPDKELKTGTRNLLLRLSLITTLLFFLASIPSWIISKAIMRRKNYQIQLQYSASYDQLSNLPNRALFYDRLSQTLSQSKRYQQKFSLLFIDLDGFKSVNDSLGHGAGDDLLIEAAKRLLNCVRDSDTVARMGGDEFTIILQVISNPEDSQIVAKKILQGLSIPFQLGAHEVQIGASIGISTYPENAEDVETLMKKADEAMYLVKKSGKNNFKFSL